MHSGSACVVYKKYRESRQSHAACFFLVFLIKITFISVRPEQQPFSPRRRPTHLLTDGVNADIPVAFDDKFIMDMANNITASQRLHGIAEDVPADGLDDVLHELRAIAFEPFPLLCCADAFIGDGFPAEAVLAYPGLYVGKPPSAGELYEQHAALIQEADEANPHGDTFLDGCLHGGVHLPPEIDDVRIG